LEDVVKKLVGFIFFLGVFLLPGRADAAISYCNSTTNCSLTFNVSGPDYGEGPFGAINLVLVGSDINVTVDLAGDQATGFHMIENGSHIAFGLNVNDDTGLGLVGAVTLSSISAGYSQVANNNSPATIDSPAQGVYNISLTSTCNNGGGCGLNIVSFVASRAGGFVDVNQLIFPNASGRFATADVALLGDTGPIFSTTVVGGIPEPSTVVLIGAGLAGIGLLRRKRRV
jgi:hypothetical protein